MIYLDNAATTKIAHEALDAMSVYLTDQYGNASTFYDLGLRSHNAIDNARHIIAQTINADDDEIFFTSGGTESDNWAIKCRPDGYDVVVTSQIEHDAILRSLPRYSIKAGVLQDGVVDVDQIKRVVGNNTLVSVMFANNEIGTIQPIPEIAEIVHKAGGLMHTDAVQAYCHVPIDVKSMKIDLLSASSHKIHGPKGIGFLYIKKELQKKWSPYITGGHQERGMRAGTENVASIVGFGAAAKVEYDNLISGGMDKVANVRDYLEDKILRNIPDVKINGANRLPGNLNVTISNVKAEELLEILNEHQIYASSGSACTTGDESPSHVLTAIGLSPDEANATLRFSLDRENTMREMNNVVEVLKDGVDLLR